MRYSSIKELHEMERNELEELFSDAHVFEKIDGGNCQITKNGQELSHAARKGKFDREEAVFNPWYGEFEKFFWINQVPLLSLEDGSYFLEFTSPHTLEYKAEYTNKIFLIDVKVNEEIIPYNKAVAKIQQLPSILTLATLYQGKVDHELLDELLNRNSPFSASGLMEGLVIKNYEKGIFGKIKHPKFSDLFKIKYPNL